MNLRVRTNINWFVRLHGAAFQNIVPIFVSCFPSFGRGFDSHRPLHKQKVRPGDIGNPDLNGGPGWT